MQLAPFAETKGAKHQNMELFAIYLLPNRPQSITQQRFQRIYEGCQILPLGLLGGLLRKKGPTQ